jgi:hypothetical protein
MPSETMANMPKKPNGGEGQYVAALRGAVRKVDLRLEGADELPLIYANHMIVNYTGTEFLVSVADSLPAPFSDPKIAQPAPGQKLRGKVIARYAFSPYTWALVVQSMMGQIETLQKQGLLPILNLPAE